MIPLSMSLRANVFSCCLLAICWLGHVSQAHGQPSYRILPLVLPGQSNSSGTGISSSGSHVAGTSNQTGISWTESGGTVALNALPGRSFSLVQDINDHGVVVGTGATTFFGSSPLPVVWNGIVAAQLPLPAGQTLGRAFSVNNSTEAVGSVNAGSLERAAKFTTGSSTVLTQTMANGGPLVTAYANNDAGRIVGQAWDPTNAAVTLGFYLDPGDAVAHSVGALSSRGHNSSIAFALSDNGFIAGASSLNSGVDTRPFLWSDTHGMQEIPIPAGMSFGSARGVNTSGWVVGNMSAATSIPFLFTGTNTYQLHDLLEPVTGVGWDLVSGTSNAALGIGDNGVITGRGLLNGQITGFVMLPVPEPNSTCCLLLAVILIGVRCRQG